MGKKEELLKSLGGNMNESIGIRPAVHGEPPAKELVKKNEKYMGRTRSRTAGEMELARIIPDPNQPRKQFGKDDLGRMADNVKKVGILQPIRVRWSESHGKWMIISGERRYRAARLAGLESIPCIFVEDELEETDLRAEQLIENCQRENLKPIEQATAFQALVDQTGWSMQRLANELNLSKASVVRSLALLNLPDDVRAKVESRNLTASAAYAISQVDGEARQRQLAMQATERNLSRDQVVELTKSKTPDEAPQVNKLTRRITTRHAIIIVEHNDAHASEADIQAALLAAVKQIGRECIEGSRNATFSPTPQTRKRTRQKKP
jgi:ParB family chromosome partitioning protein